MRERAGPPLDRADAAIAIGLFVGCVIVLSITQLQLGFTRDEGYYFKAAELYFGWFRDLGRHLARGDLLGAFDQSVIDRHWKYNHEHPVLVKTAFALSWGLLKETLGLFTLHSSAMRFPAWCFAGLAAALTYVLGRTLVSRRAGVLAALMWLSMPRAFWQMHLSCFDIPVCAAHLWLVIAYLRGRWSSMGAVTLGLLFGLAISVKHNVLVAPAFFVLHWLLIEARGTRWVRAGLRVPALPLTFFTLAFLGPIVFVLHWPYLWPSVVERAGWYLGFHLNHEHYPILWFGELLTKPPFPISFPFVMSAITVPAPVLGLLVTGAGLGSVVVGRALWLRARGRHHDDVELTLVPLGDIEREPSASPALLLLLNAAFPFLLIAMPSSPIFGGTKHWMNALPFLCVLGAWSLEEGLARLRRAAPALPAALRSLLVARRGLLAFVVVGALVVLPGGLLTARIHPYGLASYNSLVGYARGAASVGFQRTFWGYEPRLVLPEVNARADKRARIHFGDTNKDDFNMYRRDGLLRSDIGYSGSVKGADVASVQPQGEFKEQWTDVLNEWPVNGPDHVVHIEGVPLLTVTFKP